MPKHTDFTLEQGATWKRTLTLVDKNGDPLDLSGASARMQAREKIADTATVLSVSTGTGEITITTNKIAIVIPATVTAALPYRTQKKLFYDVEMQIGDEVTRLLSGGLTVSPEVTR